MKIKKIKLFNEPCIIEPNIYADRRGFLNETWNENAYNKQGIKFKVVQTIHSYSKKNVLRGIHYQYPNMQGKLVSVINGKIFDVIVDIRKNSPTFGKWYGTFLDSVKKRQLWIPEGFGHGFLVVSKTASIIYQCAKKYLPNNQRQIVWNDPFIKIEWPTKKPILSKQDSQASSLLNIKNLPIWKK